MKLLNLILIIACLSGSCSRENLSDTEKQSEIGLDFSISPYDDVSTRALDYLTIIKHMRILIFDMNGLLYHQIVLPEGAGAPTKIRLPWGKYNFIFAGNFPGLSVSEGITTINDVLATMPDDPNFPDPDICITPTDDYYYYMVPAPVQMGVVKTINVSLRPVTSQITINIKNAPAGTYNTYDLEIRGIGKNLSMQGGSLAPPVRVVKYNLTATAGVVTSTVKTFAGTGSSYIRLYARASTFTDTLDYAFKAPIQTGKSSVTNLVFHPVELSVSPRKLRLEAVFLEKEHKQDKIATKQ